MKDILLMLLKSLVITFIVAAAASYFIAFFGIPFFQSFALFVALQFLGFYFYGQYQKNKSIKIALQRELKEIEELNRQSTIVSCPCDRNIQANIPIDINGENNYLCPGCNKNIAVFITTKTALATNPLTINPLESPIFLESIEQKLKEQRNAI